MKNAICLWGLVSGFTLAFAACSSSTAAPPAQPASGGSAGSGTAGSGTAGSTGGTGTAGTGTAGTGTAGTGTAGTGTGGGAACVAPSAPLITDFSGTGGLVSGMPYTGGDPGGTVAPTAVTTSGSLVMTFGGGATTTMFPYAFVGMGLNSCTDASAYTGVTFTASGTLSAGCTIQFSVIDKEHATSGGTCTTGCYPGGTIFTPAATATPVTLPFAGQPAGGTDVAGAAPVDPTQILSIQWQVNPPAAGCTGTITVDDVKFE